jgi:hypothetical protein
MKRSILDKLKSHKFWAAVAVIAVGAAAAFGLDENQMAQVTGLIAAAASAAAYILGESAVDAGRSDSGRDGE